MNEPIYTLRSLIPKMRRISDGRYGARLKGRARLRFEVIRRTRWIWRPLEVRVDAFKGIRKDGAWYRNEADLPFRTQFRHQVRLARQFDFAPDDYYTLMLFERLDEASLFISKKQWGFLLEFLLASQNTTQAEMLDDKLACQRHYEAHGLQTTDLVAVFRDGSCVSGELFDTGRLPDADLFSKPTGGRLGAGATRWMRDGSGRFRTVSGDTFDEAGLIARLERQSVGRTMLLQKRAFNHPEIETLLGPTLANARIFTMRPPEGPAGYLTGFMSVPVQDIIASNHIDEEVYLCPVDADTGRIGAGIRVKVRKSGHRVTTHPKTNMPIEGFVIPYWKEAVSLAVRAHDTFDEVAIIGWDIGFTKDGPIIIEGNRTPGGTAAQKTHDVPWGRTHFPEVYLQHLRLACPELFDA